MNLKKLHWVATALAVILLVLWARSVNWAAAWRSIRNAALPVLVAAAAVNFLSLVVKGARWWIFLRAVGECSLGVSIRSTIAGSGLNNVLPASGGEAARVMFVRRHAGVSSAAVVATLTLDRFTDVLSYATLLVLAPLAGALPQALARWSVEADIGFVVIIALAVTLVRRAARRTTPTALASNVGAVVAPGVAPAAAERGAARATPSRIARMRAWASRFAAGLASLPTPQRLIPALALSLVSWSLQIATYHLTARAAGFQAPVMASAAAVLAVNIAFLLQLTPGNVGIFQLIYALIMSAFGLSHDEAVGVALLIQTLQIIPVTLLAVVIAPELTFRRGQPRAAPGRSPTSPGDEDRVSTPPVASSGAHLRSRRTTGAEPDGDRME